MHAFDLTDMTVEAVKEFGLSRKDASRAKNMFALGLLSWMYGRPTESTIAFLERRFAKAPDIRDANVDRVQGRLVLRRDDRGVRRPVRDQARADAAGTYRNITGNLALAYGLIAGSTQSGLPLFLGSYPITPASDILHELSKHKRFGVTTFQAEDEIAGVGAALGASFGGALGVTTTSGPGHRAEVRDDRPRRDDGAAAARRRRAARRPVDRAADQDRAGRPAAGDVRPQRRGAGADRRAAVAGRLLRRRRRGHSDRGHLPHPGDAALRRLCSPTAPSRGGSPRSPTCRRSTRTSPPSPTTRAAKGGGDEFWPYLRDEETLARPWAVPGTPGLEHRIGGLEKGDGHGNISYDPANHDLMVRTRAAKVERIARDIPPLEVDDPVPGPDRAAGQGAGARLGVDVRPDRRRGPPGPRLPACRSPRPTCATSTRSRRTSATC